MIETQTPTPTNTVNSVVLFIAGQILYFIPDTFLSHLEFVFKVLSIISVGMVIVINFKPFISKLKALCKPLKSSKNSSKQGEANKPIHPNDGSVQAHDEKD